MSNHQEEKSNNSIYYVLALIFGILTAWVVTGSLLWIFIGAILGLLTAGFYVNVLANRQEEA